MGGSSMAETMERGSWSSIADQIELSKSRWSETVKSNNSNDDEVADNVRVFKELRIHPTWDSFFVTFAYDMGRYKSLGELMIGEKFAEGDQAELYHAHVQWRNQKYKEWDLEHGRERVLKIFKEGTLLRHSQSRWPQQLLQFHAEKVELENERDWDDQSKDLFPGKCNCDVNCGMLLKDGRLAF